MKKLMIAAMMVLSATSAFAGDSDALKAVLKAKTFADAKNLVEQNLGSMANDAEKAKAYNHLVDLAMKQFNDQQSIQQMNQITKKNDPVDMEAMNEGAYNALIAAQECYKYDQLPNAKGKVAPKYDGNKDRVWGGDHLRGPLLFSGTDYGRGLCCLSAVYLHVPDADQEACRYLRADCGRYERLCPL